MGEINICGSPINCFWQFSKFCFVFPPLVFRPFNVDRTYNMSMSCYIDLQGMPDSPTIHLMNNLKQSFIIVCYVSFPSLVMSVIHQCASGGAFHRLSHFSGPECIAGVSDTPWAAEWDVLSADQTDQPSNAKQLLSHTGQSRICIYVCVCLCVI